MKKRSNNFLKDMNSRFEYLPVLVYFVQTLNDKSGDYNKFLGQGYDDLDKFIAKYSTLSINEKIYNLLVKVDDYSSYLEMRDMIMFDCTKGHKESMATRIKEVLEKQKPASPDSSESVSESEQEDDEEGEEEEEEAAEGVENPVQDEQPPQPAITTPLNKEAEAEQPTPQEPTIPHYSEALSQPTDYESEWSDRWHFWLTLIDEFYLPHLLDSEERVQASENTKFILIPKYQIK